MDVSGANPVLDRFESFMARNLFAVKKRPEKGSAPHRPGGCPIVPNPGSTPSMAKIFGATQTSYQNYRIFEL